MACGTACAVAIIFAISTLFFPLLLNRKAIMGYKREFPIVAQRALRAATRERAGLAFEGLVLGMIAGMFLVLLAGKMGKMSSVCTLAATAFVVQFFYYMLSPKSVWVLKHLHTPGERHSWLRLYREYQKAYYGSIIAGIVGAGLLGYGLC